MNPLVPGHILNAEGDTVRRAFVTSVLHEAGFQVQEATTGAEALSAAGLPLDLMLLGTLPDQPAAELCRSLKSNPLLAPIPVVLIQPLHVRRGLPQSQWTSAGPPLDYPVPSVSEPDTPASAGLAQAARLTSTRPVGTCACDPDGCLSEPLDPLALVTTVHALLRARAAETIARGAAWPWQAAFDAMSQAVCLLDGTGAIQRCNPAMAELLGSPATDLIGRPFRTLAEAELGPLHLPPAVCVSSPSRRSVTELPIGERWFRATVDPVTDESGRVAGMVLVLSDITDRKCSEESLLISEERFRAVSELTSDYAFAYQIKPDGQICRQWTTGAFTRITGYLPEELDRIGWQVLHHPDDEHQFRARLQAMKACQSDVREWRILTRDGETRWMRDSARAVWDPATGGIQVYGASQDITEQKRAEARLQSVMSHGRCLLWHAFVERDPYCAHRYYWTMRIADEAAAERFLPVEVRPGETYSEAWHRSKLRRDRDRMSVNYRQALERRAAGYAQEFRCRSREGEIRWLREDVSIESLPPQNGRRRWHLVGICTDITARRQMEQELRATVKTLQEAESGHRQLLAREQEARTEAEAAQGRLAFLAAASALLSTSLDYETTLTRVAPLVVPHLADWCIVDMAATDGTVRRLAVAHADPAKQPLVEELLRFPPDPNSSEPVPAVLRTSRAVLFTDVTDETLVQVSRGPEHLCVLRALAPRSAMGVPILARGRTLGVITFMASESGRRYSTEELRMAEDLAHRVALAVDNARLYREAQDADRLKNEFLGMLAHELRNPLAAISNAIRLLRMRGPEEPFLRRQQAVLERQVIQMTRLLDDLLDVSRITRGKIELRLQPTDLGALVEQAVEACRSLIEERGHDLSVSLPAERVRLEADPIRVLQILGNLLNNAAKYTEPGGRIELSAACEDGEVVVRVRDTGTGLDPDLLPRVFDLFVQSDRSLDRSQGGLGVGLTIVRRLAELHGGSVSATSDGPGRGSQFVVRLPVSQATADRRQPTSQRSADQSEEQLRPDDQSRLSAITCSPSPEAKRILVVDDNVDAAQSMAELLDAWGYHTRMAYDGLTALAVVRDYHPEVVLLDIGLPGMDGYEVARRLRQEAKGQRPMLVAVTGYGAGADRRRAREVGFDQYLTKPVELGELERLLSNEEADG